jgi:HK97 family phage major capsid protein
MVTKAIPRTSEELEEALSGGHVAKWAMSTDPEDQAKFRSFMEEYAALHRKHDPDIDKQIAEGVAKGLKEFYDANETIMPEAVKRVPMDPSAAGKQGLTRSDRMAIYKHLELTRKEARQIAANGTGAGMDAGEFEDFIDFARAISPHITRQGLDARVKVLGESQGDQGGFLVPEEFRAELLRMSLEAAAIRPRARVLPMATLTTRIPTIRDTTHASNVYGGVTAYWIPESGTITQSEPTFAQAVLTAKKLVGGTRISNELLRDSAITLEPLLNTLFAEALAYFEDDAFIAGIGGGQPLGIKNADALVSVGKETGQAATTLVVENIIKMFARMLPSSIMRSIWLVNPDVQPQLYTMSLSVGTGGAPMYFPAGGITGAPTPMLLGRPVVYTEKAETLGTAGDVYLVDPSYYLIGDRMQLEMASSEHVRFSTDETDFRFIQRVDGRPWIDSALTPRNGSNTLTPFLSVATRA